MKVNTFRVAGIRTFEDTGDIELSNRCTIFVGRNNSGKSTLLRALLSLQGYHFDNPNDFRPKAQNVFWEVVCDRASYRQGERVGAPDQMAHQIVARGSITNSRAATQNRLALGGAAYPNSWPDNVFTPFLAGRKTSQFQEGVHSGVVNAIDGTYTNLFGRIDMLATAGHPRHEDFVKAVQSVTGMSITTRAASNGKRAGYYLDDDLNFVSLDRMGDGITEMVALIVALCLEREKVFVLEEPEVFLHPRGLKDLLALVREASLQNQFVVATHSNIVLRELGSIPDAKIYRVSRPENTQDPSLVEQVASTEDRTDVLRDLGYEFADLGLHEAWLFLEEASAESIINDVLLPNFAPELKGRLRTFSAGGATRLSAAVSDFKRLVAFVHLQPAYEGRIWVRADADEVGKAAIAELRNVFPKFDDETCTTFSASNFEQYYPDEFGSRARAALEVQDKRQRQAAKASLVKEVLQWSRTDHDSRSAWEKSAAEPIALLTAISTALTT